MTFFRSHHFFFLVGGSNFSLVSSQPILLLHAPHGNASLLSTAFRDDLPSQPQAAICSPCSVLSLLGPAGRGGTEMAPDQGCTPQQQKGWTPSSPRQAQTPTKGREGAQGSPAGGQILTLRPARKEAGCQPNPSIAPKGPQPTAQTGKDGNVTHSTFTAFQLLSSNGCCDAAEQRETSHTGPPPEQPVPIAMVSAAGRWRLTTAMTATAGFYYRYALMLPPVTRH